MPARGFGGGILANKLTINGRGESGQDNFAFEVCGRKPTGTFLDIGCALPRETNNTFALEEVGWTGVLVDIDPQFQEVCTRERKSRFVLGDATVIDWREIYPCSEGEYVIDYLSLDVDENKDKTRALTVLQNLHAAGLRFRVATIEHDAYKNGDQPRRWIRKFMLFKAGYTLAHGDVEIRKGNEKPFEDWWLGDL